MDNANTSAYPLQTEARGRNTADAPTKSATPRPKTKAATREVATGAIIVEGEIGPKDRP
jgi:hypothetical protein